MKKGNIYNIATFKAEKGPGRRWFNGFIKRHLELGMRTAEYLYKYWSQTTEKVIRNWFEKVCNFYFFKLEI